MKYLIDNQPAPINTSNKNRTERIIQNCKNLLMTRMGEVPYDRYRGFDTRMFDKGMVEVKRSLNKMLDNMLLYEPYAELVESSCSLLEDGSLYIQMIVDINEDGD